MSACTRLGVDWCLTVRYSDGPLEQEAFCGVGGLTASLKGWWILSVTR